MSSPLSLWWCWWWRLFRPHLLGKTVDGANGVATLTGESGGRVAGDLTAIMAGAVTAGVEIAGTTAGAETAGGQVMAVFWRNRNDGWVNSRSRDNRWWANRSDDRRRWDDNRRWNTRFDHRRRDTWSRNVRLRRN
ncbi:MAG: hypothetical protein AABN95_26700 [Acidobacteriota bacterium]